MPQCSEDDTACDREPVKAIGITCPHATYFADFGNKTRAAALEEVQTVSAKAGKLVTEALLLEMD
jgi:hypothetical protein